jgi:very-short-patch-repair endonuclease/predicted transcriptional regulator of viral defense system
MLDMALTEPQRASPSLDEAIAQLAARQHGVVSRDQLRGLGLSDGGIAGRIRRGTLHRRHQGVYAVGHTVLGARGHWMAAVLACGENAVPSHAAAGALWGLRRSAATTTDVTLPGSGGRRRKAGIRIHRARSIHATTHEGIPVTTPERTIVDLAATLRRRPLERVLDQAENTRLTDVPSLLALAKSQAGHRGAGKLITALTDHQPGTTLTKSELEERFLKLCRDANLPKPIVNDYVEALEADFIFDAQRILVETDSWRHHRTREAFESDRRRDAIHAAAGWRTLRFTHRQIAHDPATVIRALTPALTRPASSPPSSDTPSRSAA